MATTFCRAVEKYLKIMGKEQEELKDILLSPDFVYVWKDIGTKIDSMINDFNNKKASIKWLSDADAKQIVDYMKAKKVQSEIINIANTLKNGARNRMNKVRVNEQALTDIAEFSYLIKTDPTPTADSMLSTLKGVKDQFVASDDLKFETVSKMYDELLDVLGLEQSDVIQLLVKDRTVNVTKKDLLSKFVDADTVIGWRGKINAFIDKYVAEIEGWWKKVYQWLLDWDLLKTTWTKLNVEWLVNKYIDEISAWVDEKRLIQIQDEISDALAPVVEELEVKRISDAIEANRKIAQSEEYMNQAWYTAQFPLKYVWGKQVTKPLKVTNEWMSDDLYKQYINDFLKPHFGGRSIDNITEDDVRIYVEPLYADHNELTGLVDVTKLTTNIFEVKAQRNDGGVNIYHINTNDVNEIQQSLNYTARQWFLDPFAKTGLGIHLGNPLDKEQALFVEQYKAYVDGMWNEEKAILNSYIRGSDGEFESRRSNFLASIETPEYQSSFGSRFIVSRYLLRNNDYLKAFAKNAHRRIQHLNPFFSRFRNEFDKKIRNFFYRESNKIKRFEVQYNEHEDLFQVMNLVKKLNSKDLLETKVPEDQIKNVWQAYRTDKNIIHALRQNGYIPKTNDENIRATFREVVKNMNANKSRDKNSFLTSMSFAYTNFKLKSSENYTLPDMEYIGTIVDDMIEGYSKAYFDMYRKIDKVKETKKWEELTQDLVRETITKSYLSDPDMFNVRIFNAESYSTLKLMKKTDSLVYWDSQHFKKMMLSNKWVTEKKADRLFGDYMGQAIGPLLARRWRNLAYEFKLNWLTTNGKVLALQDFVTNGIVNHSLNWFYRNQNKEFSDLTRKLFDLEDFDDIVSPTPRLESSYMIDAQKNITEAQARTFIDRFAEHMWDKISDVWNYGTKKTLWVDIVPNWANRSKKYRKTHKDIKAKLKELWVKDVNTIEDIRLAVKNDADFLEIQRMFNDAGDAVFSFDSLSKLKRAGESSELNAWEVAALFSSPQNVVPLLSRMLWFQNKIFNRVIEEWNINLQWLSDVADEIKRLKKTEKDLRKKLKEVTKGEDVEFGRAQELKTELTRVKSDKQQLINYVEDQYGAILKEAEEIYQRQMNISTLIWDNRNGFSQFWMLNFFSWWGSKMVGYWTHYLFLDNFRKFHETYMKYGAGPATKEFMANMVNSPQLRSLLWSTKIYLKAMMNMDKDNDFEAYDPQGIWDKAFKWFQLSPFYVWLQSFFVTRALWQSLDQFDWALDLGYRTDQALGKSMNAFLYGVFSNIGREFRQLGLQPVATAFNAAVQNKGIGVDDVADILVDYFAQSISTYSAYSLNDVYKGAKFDRLDQDQIYPLLDMVLGTSITKYRWEVDNLIKDSFDLKTLKEKWDKWFGSFLDPFGALNQAVALPTYYSTKLKLGQYQRLVEDDADVQAAKSGDFSWLSDAVLDFAVKNTKKYTWSGLYKDDPEASDEAWQLGFVIADIEAKWVNPNSVLNVFKYWDLDTKKRKLAELEVAGASKYSIMMLMNEGMKQATDEFKDQYKDQTGVTAPKDVQERLTREYMRQNIEVFAEIDKNFHKTVVEWVIRDKHGGQIAGIKEIGKWGQASSAFRLLSMGILAELVDLDKIEFDRRNVNNVFSVIFDDIPEDKKAQAIIQAHDTIEELPWVTEYWKEATKAAMLFSEMKNLKKFLTDPKATALKDDVRRLAEIIIDVDHRTDTNPSYLKNLYGSNFKLPKDWIGARKRADWDMSWFPSQVKLWLKSLRSDIFKTPELKRKALNYITSSRSNLTLKPIVASRDLLDKISIDDREKFFEVTLAPEPPRTQISRVKLPTWWKKRWRKRKKTKRARKLKIKKTT